MITKSPAALAALFACALLAPGVACAELVRFVQVVKNETPDTRFHLGELEAFANGVVPDESGGGSFGGMLTSTNDIGDGTLVTFGDGNILPDVGTTSALEHGGANKNPNNALESGGAVWSTANAQATNSQYTLDLGGTVDVTTIRMWPRADGCCTARWQNLEVHLFADAGDGTPGALIASNTTDGLAPGGNVPLELTFFAGSTEIDTLEFTPAFTFPTESDPAILSSAAVGTVVGTLSALNEFGGPIPSATFSLVAGDGDTNNGLYEIDGTKDLQVLGSLSGLDGVEHSVRVQGSSDEGDVEMAFTFTVILDSDDDGLVDSWELMFGELTEFMTGGDADGDGDNDEEEFLQGTDPSVPHGALFLERFTIDDGGFVEEATGNSPIASVYNAGPGTWSMFGDDSGPATNTLDSPPITVPVTGGIQVSFDHRYSIEPEWDGTALQVSIDGGPFETVPHTSFTQNGYTFFGLIGNHVLGDGDGFNGDSMNYAAGEFITSVADVGGVEAGGTITLRFLGAWDEGVRGPGTPNWEIDSVRADILPDQDEDGMPDSYEDANGLDKTMDDAGGDLDEDMVSNLDEFFAGTNPDDADTDDDGLNDGVETGSGTFAGPGDTGTDPLVADTDGDGRTDGEEVNGPGFTSDPTNADTDGDGYGDGLEVNAGTNPNDPNSFPPLALLAYFNFDGQLEDQTGNSPDLVLGGAAALTTGGMGVTGNGSDESLELNGVNDGSYAETPEGGHLDLASEGNTMSVSFWQFNTGIGNTSAFWIWAPLADGNQRGFQAHTPWGNGTVFFDQSGCCDGPERLTVANVHLLNEWQHFVFQRDAEGNREIWVDGALVASAGGADPLDPFNGIITVGAEGPTHGNSFGGRIDDFAIFGDALTPEQIAELAAGATPADLIGPGILFQIIDIQLNEATNEFTLTWNSRENETYGVFYGTDLIDFGADVNDSIASGGETTSITFPHPSPGVPELYFRVIEN